MSVVVVDVGGGGLRWYNCNYDLSLYSFALVVICRFLAYASVVVIVVVVVNWRVGVRTPNAIGYNIYTVQ